MKEKETKSILNIVKEGYIEIGRETNLNRSFVSIYDGLKPSYKKVLLSCIDLYPKVIKTAGVIGSTLSCWHSHGESSLKGVVAELVRSNILENLSDFGFYSMLNDDIEGAAPRYTQTRLSENLYPIIKEMLPYVPTELNYTRTLNEPIYIPTAIPFALMTSSRGIGLGVAANIPAFTAQSLLDAYLSDNYKLLKNPFGCKIVDKNELKSLWETGVGALTLQFKVYESKYSDCGFIIQGVPKEFKPDFKELELLEEEGKLIIKDISDYEGQKVLIERLPNIKSLPREKLKQLVLKAATKTIQYKIIVQDKNKAFAIGIKKWIDFCYKNCLNLLEQNRKNLISKKKFDILVFSNFRSVADFIINNDKMSYQDIANLLEIPLEVVEAVSRHSIGSLRTFDPKDKVAKLKKEIKEQEDLDLKDKIKNIIYKL